MIKKTVFACLVYLAAMPMAKAAAESCSAPVPTSEGPVIGAEDSGTCAYKGIPYAVPPVGDMRWKSPVRPARRTAPLEALKFGPECAQTGMAGGPENKQIGRSEDCLYLNVWTPNTEGKRPVMFWIHGGGLANGSGSVDLYWGDKLAAEKDVILVTFNYRLTVFGFLSLMALSDEDANGRSGNYGVLDQIEALKWVKENIANFGGDPDNITIFGESAGGWSVCYLLTSPLAKGLFNKAIIQSGGCDATKSVEDGYSDGHNLVIASRCADKNQLQCLRGKTTEELLEAAGSIVTGITGPIKFTWLPKEDGYVFKDTPIVSLRQGDYNKVPLMVGSNRDEVKFMLLMTPGIRRLPRWMYRGYVRNGFGKETLTEIERLYPAQNYLTYGDSILDALGDMSLGCKNFDAIEAAATHQKEVYYYRFDYDVHRAPNMVGAAHALEIPFIFGSLDKPATKLLYTKKMRNRARPLSEAMMSYWTNFAKTGVPASPGLVNWPAYNLDARQRMFLDLPIHVGQTDNLEKCEFWRSQGIRF